jgi:hypothetical protein
MKNKWTKNWPVKEGQYWFYGWRFKHDNKEEPELSLVEVHISGNKVPMHVTRGHFLYKEEGAEGLWSVATLPDLPKL